MGKEGSVWYNRVLNCLIRRKIKRWKKSKIRKGGERRILKADSHIASRAHAVPLPYRAAKGLECVFPI
jgi:hypothetical protein